MVSTNVVLMVAVQSERDWLIVKALRFMQLHDNAVSRVTNA